MDSAGPTDPAAPGGALTFAAAIELYLADMRACARITTERSGALRERALREPAWSGRVGSHEPVDREVQSRLPGLGASAPCG
jgi:hypothetical protein